MTSVAKILRAPLPPPPKRGANPGFWIAKMMTRVEEVEAENARLRALLDSTTPRRAPKARKRVLGAVQDRESASLRAAWYAISPFLVGTPRYDNARTAYLLAEYGTTNRKAIAATWRMTTSGEATAHAVQLSENGKQERLAL